MLGLFAQTFLTISCYYKDYGSLIRKQTSHQEGTQGRKCCRASLGNPLSGEHLGNKLSSSAVASQEDDTVGSSRRSLRASASGMCELRNGARKTQWSLEPKSPNGQSQSPFADGDQHRGSRCCVLGEEQCEPGAACKIPVCFLFLIVC